MADRSSRPHAQPAAGPRPVPSGGSSRSACCAGGDRPGSRGLLRLAPSTVHRVLTRYGLARLAHLDRATGRVDPPLRTRPGPASWSTSTSRSSATSPTAAATRSCGPAAATARAPQPAGPRRPRPNLGYSYLHTAVDDHSRLAYSEILADEKKETAAAFWRRAHAFFAQAGITVERVLTDNGSCYRSRALARRPGRDRASPTSAPAPTGPRPTARSNASTAPCSTSGPTPAPTAQKPNAAKPSPHWLHTYNHHRGHTALEGQPPASRVPNLSGQYT